MRSMCVGVAETGHREFSLCADGIEYIFFALSVGYTLGFYLVGVGAYDDPRSRGIDTYAKHVCRHRRDRGRPLVSREKSYF